MGNKIAQLTKEYMEEVKRSARELPQTARKRAIVGMDSLAKRILLRIYNALIKSSKIKAFDSVEEAKDWLVAD